MWRFRSVVASDMVTGLTIVDERNVAIWDVGVNTVNVVIGAVI